MGAISMSMPTSPEMPMSMLTCESGQHHVIILVRKQEGLSQLDKHNMW